VQSIIGDAESGKPISDALYRFWAFSLPISRFT